MSLLTELNKILSERKGVRKDKFDGRVQPRMERTLRAITPHDQPDIPSALRSFPSFGD
jgi:hypothetical protein